MSLSNMISVPGVDKGVKNYAVFELVFVSCLCLVIASFAPEQVYILNGVDERNYILISPEVLRPLIPYGIMVHVFDNVFNRCSNRTIDLYASIYSKSNESIASSVTNIFCNSPEIVNLQIPISLPSDVYRLHVFAVDSVDKKKIFDNSKQLIYQRNFVSVVFQTTRPIYSSGQLVRFRILVLQTSLIPFNDVMDVFVLDPDGLIMRRWLSTYTNNGVLTLNFKLPKLAKDGIWKIRSQINNQIDEQSIIVETYFQPFFEVIVSSSPYIPETENNVTATIYGIFPSQKLARGNATITWSARKYRENDTFHVIQTENVFIKEIRYQATLPFETIRTVFETLVGIEIKILVFMTEFMSGETMSGFSHSRIISNDIRIRFLSQSPIVFTPGMPLRGHVSVSYNDIEKIPREILENSILRIELKCDTVFPNGKHVSEVAVGNSIDDESKKTDLYEMLRENQIRDKFLESGILAYDFDIPVSTKSASLRATFIHKDAQSEINIDTIKRNSFDDKYISVWTSSDDLKVNEYALFHVKTNFPMDNLYSIVSSKNIILQVYEHEISSGSLVTFSVPLSGDMAPLFHLIVYSLSNDRVIRSDTVTVPVDGFSRYETTFEVNTGKDFKIERVEALASGGEGAFIGIQASRSAVYHLQGGNEITRSRISNNFLKFERSSRSVNKIDRITSDGSVAPESFYFLAHNVILDDSHSFELNGLNMWSNLKKFDDLNRKCDNYESMNATCLLKNCALKSELCRSVRGCNDDSDQMNCITIETPDEEYYLNRTNRNYFIYDAKEGDWAFTQIKKNDHVGVEFEFLNTPRTSDDWYFTVFNMHMIYGFSIIRQPVVFSSTRPLMAFVMGPSKCHRGEQLGLKLHLHNHDYNQMLVIVTLAASNDYKFVNVESEGVVSSYGARLTSGDRQILVYMAAKSETEIRFPVAPSVEQGLIEVVFLVSSQTGLVNVSHFVHVKSEGVLINRHTSLTMDLVNRGFTLDYLDIITEESPFVPYQYWRRYVYGSPAANITFSNDVIGPINFENLFTLDTLLKREPKGAIDYASELNANVWILHYLRLTNQLTPDILKNTLKECNSLYSTIIRYFNVEGFFSNWEPASSYPSVWLSAWVIRILKYANFSEWQFLIWIDSYIIRKTLQWLLANQHSEGYFTETIVYRETPFDSRFIFNSEAQYRIALTAHVLITVQTVVEFGDGDLNTHVIVSILNARKYLEKKLSSSIHDPYLLALISYALRITNSPESNYAFTRLHKAMQVNEDGYIYWSQTPIPSNPVKLENQRPYRMPRLYQKTDSQAVEATSWALLVYLANEGVTPVVENIVKWLISTRMSNYGFISIIDTNVAYHALTEYAHRARFLDLTNIYLDVEIMASNFTSHHIHISNKSINSYFFEIPFVWGHIHVVGKGAGVAYIQMDVDYGVDHEHLVDKPELKMFDLQITEFYSQFRNKSMITIQSCPRFIGESFRSSGAVVLEIQIPTGYFLLETQASEIIRRKVHPTLRDVRTIDGKTIWFFDFINRETYCFNHTVTRWYPVGNLTLCRQALLYALTARENFVQVLINSTALQTLSICEVCGSFQCPYCPYFNGSIVSAMFVKQLLCIPILFIVNAFLKNE
ncbi:ovostatin-like [Planococcus citri]|uniref:ovostatin-like n=1 Tax=Planococcus citri TaxID=170843 RepID=UPI0031F777BC